MSLNSDTYDTIEKYLSGKLSKSDIESFEKEISNNPDLKKEVNAEKAINELMFNAKMRELSLMVDDSFENAYNNKRNSFSKNVLIISLVLLASMGLAALFYFVSEEPVQETQSKIELKQETSSNTFSEKENGSIVNKKPLEVHHEQLQVEYIDSDSIDNYTDIKDVLVIETITDQIVGKADDELNDSESNTSIDLVDESNISQATIKNEILNLVEKDTCPNKIQTIHYKAKKPSLDVDNGSISIVQDFDGLGNRIEYRISDLDEFELINEFSDLGPGNYFIQARDEKGCLVKSKERVQLKRALCSATSEKVFSSVYNDVWVLNVSESKGGSFRVLSLSGVIIKTEEFSSVSQVNWDGRTISGEEATPGQYYYEINYWDNEQCLGTVTLAR